MIKFLRDHPLEIGIACAIITLVGYLVTGIMDYNRHTLNHYLAEGYIPTNNRMVMDLNELNHITTLRKHDVTVECIITRDDASLRFSSKCE